MAFKGRIKSLRGPNGALPSVPYYMNGHFPPKHRFFFNAMCQFHQHFMCVFFVRKCFAQLFCTYGLGFGETKLAQKLLVKCWWNWLLRTWKLETLNFLIFLICCFYYCILQQHLSLSNQKYDISYNLFSDLFSRCEYEIIANYWNDCLLVVIVWATCISWLILIYSLVLVTLGHLL